MLTNLIIISSLFLILNSVIDFLKHFKVSKINHTISRTISHLGFGLLLLFIGLSVIPASTSLFRDMTGIRFEHPEWIPNNCTACGKCYAICPDTAIPGLVSDLGDVLDTVVKRVKRNHPDISYLPKATNNLSVIDNIELISVIKKILPNFCPIKKE